MITIYALKCPVTGDIRYVGKSSDPARRVRCHVNDALRNVADHHNARWLRKLLASGHEPEIVELLKVPPDFEWEALERFLIAAARHFNFSLTNSTAGGEGFDIIDSDVSRKWLTNLRAANKRPEVIASKTAASRRRAADPKDGLAKSAGCKRRYEDPAQRAGLSAKHKALWDDPVWREKTIKAIREANSNPQRRQNVSDGLKRVHQDPLVLENRRRIVSPEANAKRSQSLRATWAARKLETLRRIMEWDTV